MQEVRTREKHSPPLGLRRPHPLPTDLVRHISFVSLVRTSYSFFLYLTTAARFLPLTRLGFSSRPVSL